MHKTVPASNPFLCTEDDMTAFNGRKLHKKFEMSLVMILTVKMLTVSIGVLAAEPVTLPLDSDSGDAISVLLPGVSEEGNSPFDFIIDPQRLVYETDAAKYGGGRVEECATLLFHNHDGEYDFSRRSDDLMVTNLSNVPVQVTITATIDNLGDIVIRDNIEFENDDECSIYMAIIDNDGNEVPLKGSGEASVEIVMHQAPDNAYAYRINEETGSYAYELSTDPENIDFDVYTFGLVGYCNPNGAWQDISVHPDVKVTWRVTPVTSEADGTSDVELQTATKTDDNADNSQTRDVDTGEDILDSTRDDKGTEATEIIEGQADLKDDDGADAETGSGSDEGSDKVGDASSDQTVETDDQANMGSDQSGGNDDGQSDDVRTDEPETDH